MDAAFSTYLVRTRTAAVPQIWTLTPNYEPSKTPCFTTRNMGSTLCTSRHSFWVGEHNALCEPAVSSAVRCSRVQYREPTLANFSNDIELCQLPAAQNLESETATSA